MIYKTIQISSFVGGLNKDPSPEMIGDIQASILTDAFPRWAGSLCSRRFRVKQHAAVLGAPIHGIRQHLGSPLMMVKSGQRLFDNFTEIASNLNSTGLMSGLSFGDYFYSIDTSTAKVYNRTAGTVQKWGLDPPATPCVAVVGGVGVLNGDYYYKVTFMSGLLESAPSPFSAQVSPALEEVDLSSIPISTDSQVTGRRIYRMGGTTTEYYLVALIGDNVTTDYTDNVADGDLGILLDANNNYPPPTTCQVIVLHFLRAYMFGDTYPGHENWIWWSNADDMDHWGPYPEENYFRIGSAEPIITGLSMFRQLVAFKKDEIHVCEGTIPEEMFITQTLAKRGCVAPLAPALHKLPIFPSWDGVYSFDGRAETKLIEFADPLFDSEVDQDYLHRSVGIVWRGKYFLSYPEKGYSYPNKILVLDLEEKYARYLLDFGATAFGLDTSGQLWAGDNEGWVRKIEQETNVDSETLSLTYRSKKFPLAEIPGDVGGLATIFFRALTGGDEALVRIYLDGVCIHEKGFSSSSLTNFRKKLPAKFGRYVQVEFVYNSGGEFRIVPPVVINPAEGML